MHLGIYQVTTVAGMTTLMTDTQDINDNAFQQVQVNQVALR